MDPQNKVVLTLAVTVDHLFVIALLLGTSLTVTCLALARAQRVTFSQAMCVIVPSLPAAVFALGMVLSGTKAGMLSFVASVAGCAALLAVVFGGSWLIYRRFAGADLQAEAITTGDCVHVSLEDGIGDRIMPGDFVQDTQVDSDTDTSEWDPSWVNKLHNALSAA